MTKLSNFQGEPIKQRLAKKGDSDFNGGLSLACFIHSEESIF